VNQGRNQVEFDVSRALSANVTANLLYGQSAFYTGFRLNGLNIINEQWSRERSGVRVKLMCTAVYDNKTKYDSTRIYIRCHLLHLSGRRAIVSDNVKCDFDFHDRFNRIRLAVTIDNE